MNPTRLFCAASLVALGASSAGAVTLVGFDTARPTAPQEIEVGAGVVALDEAYGLFAQGRLGILPELDARVALGALVLDGDFGFEVDLGATRRILAAADAMVDVAVGGELGFTKTADVFLGGIDPVVHASRHFALPGERELFVGLTLGVALTLVDTDGGPDDTLFGLLGGLTAGVDIVEDIGFAFETRWRDDVWRLGGMATLDF